MVIHDENLEGNSAEQPFTVMETMFLKKKIYFPLNFSHWPKIIFHGATFLILGRFLVTAFQALWKRAFPGHLAHPKEVVG